MTTLEATVPVAQPGPPMIVRVPGPVWFLGRDRDYWRLMIRGSVLLALTLGIYRFWLTTDQRRFLWSNTEVKGHTLEYTGTARELLIGFLIAIAILIPIYGLIFMMTLDLGLIGKFAGVFGFALLAVIGNYAVFRARRYRLTRTIYRSVRFHQTGSAWLYAVYAALWSIAVLLTLGLAYPAMQATLERYKMRNTWLGNLQGRFDGTALNLFLRGVFMWLVVLGPLLGSLVAIALTLDIRTVENMVLSIGNEAELKRIIEGHPGLTAAFGVAIFGLIWPFLIGPLLYPVFQAMVWRWWASGLRFGDVAATSWLRKGRIYMLYLRFIGWSMLFSMVASFMGGLVIAIVVGTAGAIEGNTSGMAVQVSAAISGVVLYVLMALGYSVIYQVKVRLGLWRAVAESIDIANAGALDHVTSVGAPASPIGEGLADALNVGGF
jgi:uncharacterized membrane protein YjgN (DUF898 family)